MNMKQVRHLPVQTSPEKQKDPWTRAWPPGKPYFCPPCKRYFWPPGKPYFWPPCKPYFCPPSQRYFWPSSEPYLKHF